MSHRSLVDLFDERVRLSGHRPALREKQQGRWQSTTWATWAERSRAVAAWLIEQGLGPGDRVALLMATRQAWFEVDQGVLQAGGVSVPIFTGLSVLQTVHQLADSGARWLFCDNPLALERLLAPEAQAGLRGLAGAVVLDPRGVRSEPDSEGRKALDLEDLHGQTPLRLTLYGDLLREGGSLVGQKSGALAERAAGLGPSSLASIVYTSGTSGPPKGVMISHENFMFEVEALSKVSAFGPHDEQLLFLPMAHIFARIFEMAQLRVGYATSFTAVTPSLIDEIAEIEPTFFGAVPRLFEQFYAAVTRSLGQQTAGRLAGPRAIEIGREVSRLRRSGEAVPLALRLQHRAADELFFSKIRARLGGRLRFAFSGGAPLSAQLGEWFHAVGVTILEGYGLTETTSASHVNTPDQLRFGSVGRPLPGVETKIAPDGEVLLRGRNVSAGYWQSPEATAEVLDPEGWLHTGDVGQLGAQGELHITGRKKELIVLSTGHKAAPQFIEAQLQQSVWVQKAVVLGEGKSRLGALLSLRHETAFAWARAHRKPEDPSVLAHDPDIRAAVQAEIDAINQRLASFERIRTFALLDRPLSLEQGELTPTGKLRRERVAELHHATIEKLLASIA